MELIRPTEVSGKILSLIEDAKAELIIVSPYNNINEWKKMSRFLGEAKKRLPLIQYYAREGEVHRGLKKIGIEPILINRLHAKMYLNESYAIFSSMNLVMASDESSLDFALKTETEEEYREALNYFKNYILPKVAQTPEKELVNEVPCEEYFTKYSMYLGKDIELLKEYYPNTTFIKSFGFKMNGDKFGHWAYFSENGLLVGAEIFWEQKHHPYEKIEHTGNMSRYDLLFSLANIVGGLFNCSIQDFFFRSKLNFYTNGKNDALFQYIEKTLELSIKNRDVSDVQDLVDELHRCIVAKPTLNISRR